MAKYEAETEVTGVTFVSFEKYICQFCHMENQDFLIYKKFDGWTGGV